MSDTFAHTIFILVSALRSHWDDANGAVLQRKAQLDAMLADSARYDTARRECEAWLERNERRLSCVAPPADTADVLEMQQREQKVTASFIKQLF